MAGQANQQRGPTPEQLAAIRHWGTPLLVVAGPGTGKTTVLAHRILFLLQEKKVPKEQILAVTFTTKAADEMTRKLAHLGLSEANHPWIATLHAVAARILPAGSRPVKWCRLGSSSVVTS